MLQLFLKLCCLIGAYCFTLFLQIKNKQIWLNGAPHSLFSLIDVSQLFEKKKLKTHLNINISTSYQFFSFAGRKNHFRFAELQTSYSVSIRRLKLKNIYR